MKRKEEEYKGQRQQQIRAITIENFLPEGLLSSRPLFGDQTDDEYCIKYDQNQQSDRLRHIQSLSVYTAPESPEIANRIWKVSIPLALVDLVNPLVRLAPGRHTEGW